MKKKLLAIIVAAGMLAGVLAGCGETAPAASSSKAQSTKTESTKTESTKTASTSDQKIKIGFANLTDSGDYMVWVKKGMQMAAEKYGAEIVCVDNEANGAKAVENIDALITQGCQAVIEYMNDTAVNSQIKDMLDAKGIPCVAVDIPVENANGAAAYMGGDNYTAGHICGENLGKIAKEQWGDTIDLFISVETMSNGETNTQRMGGILDGIRESLNVPDDIIVRVDGKDNTADAQKVVADALTAHPDAKHILIGCLQDDETQGAFSAVEMANRQDQVLLAGCGPFGSTFENLRKPEKNFWVGSASFSPEQYGEVAVPLAIALAKGEKVPENSFVTHYWLDHDNINDYYPEG